MRNLFASATPSSAVVFATVVIPSVVRVWVAGVVVAPRTLGGVELLFLPEGAAVSAAASCLTVLLTISLCRFEHDPNPSVSRGLPSVAYNPMSAWFLQKGRS